MPTPQSRIRSTRRPDRCRLKTASAASFAAVGQFELGPIEQAVAEPSRPRHVNQLLPQHMIRMLTVGADGNDMAAAGTGVALAAASNVSSENSKVRMSSSVG